MEMNQRRILHRSQNEFALTNKLQSTGTITETLS